MMTGYGRVESYRAQGSKGACTVCEAIERRSERAVVFPRIDMKECIILNIVICTPLGLRAYQLTSTAV